MKDTFKIYFSSYLISFIIIGLVFGITKNDIDLALKFSLLFSPTLCVILLLLHSMFYRDTKNGKLYKNGSFRRYRRIEDIVLYVMEYGSAISILFVKTDFEIYSTVGVMFFALNFICYSYLVNYSIPKDSNNSVV